MGAALKARSLQPKPHSLELGSTWHCFCRSRHSIALQIPATSFNLSDLTLPQPHLGIPKSTYLLHPNSPPDQSQLKPWLHSTLLTANWRSSSLTSSYAKVKYVSVDPRVSSPLFMIRSNTICRSDGKTSLPKPIATLQSTLEISSRSSATSFLVLATPIPQPTEPKPTMMERMA